MSIVFRQLKNPEFEAAYGILVGTVDWLLSHGIRQWSRPYPRHLYEEAQRKGENYGLFCEDELLVVMSLSRCGCDPWREELGERDKLWLCRLAVKPDRHGEGWGSLAVIEAIKWSRQTAIELWLDCLQGRLPDYYEEIGFTQFAAKTVAYASGSSDMVLMKCDLSANPQE